MYTLLDTNILLRTSEPTSQHYADAIGAVGNLFRAGRTPCISSQSIYEFLAVASKPQSENGLGMPHAVADAQLEKLLFGIQVIYDSPTIAMELRRLVLQHKVTGKKTHGARIVATMNVHNITEILTFNTKDFARYPTITILSPSLVALGQLPAWPPPPTPPSN